MQRDKQRYTIGEMSEICNLSKKTLRFYDEKGLLTPLERDSENNYRYYSEQQILHALIVSEMRSRGFTLLEIKKLLEYPDLPSLELNLEEKINDIKEEIRILEEQRQSTEITRNLVREAISIVSRTKENAGTETQKSLNIRMMPEVTVLFTRYRSKVSVDELFWERYAEIKNLSYKEKTIASGCFTAIFHDHYSNQFYNDEGDLETLLPIPSGDTTKPYIKKFGNFLVASKIFVGPYPNLLPTYTGLVSLIEKSDFEISGPPIEEYLVEFSYGVAAEDCVTRVSFPIKARIK